MSTRRQGETSRLLAALAHPRRSMAEERGRFSRVMSVMERYDDPATRERLLTELGLAGKPVTSACWCCGAATVSHADDPPAWRCDDCEVTWMDMNLRGLAWTQKWFSSLGETADRPHP